MGAARGPRSVPRGPHVRRPARALRKGPTGEGIGLPLPRARPGGAARRARRVRVRIGVGPRIAPGIVLGGPRTVDQHVARLVDALRQLLGLGVLLGAEREPVRMMRDHQLAMGLLDLVVGRALREPQYVQSFGFLHGAHYTERQGPRGTRSRHVAFPSDNIHKRRAQRRMRLAGCPRQACAASLAMRPKAA